MIKLVFMMRRKQGMTATAFQEYWRSGHAKLIGDNAALFGIRRYVQSHAIPPEKIPSFRAEWDTPAAAWDGIAEVWLDSLEMLDPAKASPEASAMQAIIAADEAEFIDLEQSAMIITEEHVIVGDP